MAASTQHLTSMSVASTEYNIKTSRNYIVLVKMVMGVLPKLLTQASLEILYCISRPHNILTNICIVFVKSAIQNNTFDHTYMAMYTGPSSPL
jgi:hypothetical protein